MRSKTSKKKEIVELLSNFARILQAEIVAIRVFRKTLSKLSRIWRSITKAKKKMWSVLNLAAIAIQDQSIPMALAMPTLAGTQASAVRSAKNRG